MITKKFKQELVKKVSANFPSFGGGMGSQWNPLAEALKDVEPQFAAGVDISQVVEFIIKELKKNKV